MECLKTVGAKPGPLNFQQVMDFMKEYIMKRQLFDHSCPSRILCGQDPLGKVFGVEQFLVNDVISSNQAAADSAGGLQRRCHCH